MISFDIPSGNDPLMGPVDLQWARNCLRGMSSESFLRRYNQPALILVIREGATPSDDDDELGGTLVMGSRGEDGETYAISLVTKRPRLNPEQLPSGAYRFASPGSGSATVRRRRLDLPSGSYRLDRGLRKPTRPRHSGQWITLGRSANTDLVLRLATISKLHSIFQEVEGVWTLVDGGSTNGTFLENERLTAGAPAVIRSGATVCFGPDVTGRFLMPRDLISYILE